MYLNVDVNVLTHASHAVVDVILIVSHGKRNVFELESQLAEKCFFPTDRLIEFFFFSLGVKLRGKEKGQPMGGPKSKKK